MVAADVRPESITWLQAANLVKLVSRPDLLIKIDARSAVPNRRRGVLRALWAVVGGTVDDPSSPDAWDEKKVQKIGKQIEIYLGKYDAAIDKLADAGRKALGRGNTKLAVAKDILIGNLATERPWAAPFFASTLQSSDQVSADFKYASNPPNIDEEVDFFEEVELKRIPFPPNGLLSAAPISHAPEPTPTPTPEPPAFTLNMAIEKEPPRASTSSRKSPTEKLVLEKEAHRATAQELFDAREKIATLEAELRAGKKEKERAERQLVALQQKELRVTVWDAALKEAKGEGAEQEQQLRDKMAVLQREADVRLAKEQERAKKELEQRVAVATSERLAEQRARIVSLEEDMSSQRKKWINSSFSELQHHEQEKDSLNKSAPRRTAILAPTTSCFPSFSCPRACLRASSASHHLGLPGGGRGRMVEVGLRCCLLATHANPVDTRDCSHVPCGRRKRQVISRSARSCGPITSASSRISGTSTRPSATRPPRRCLRSRRR